MSLAEEPFPSPDPSAWILAVLPDTQVYARHHPELFVAQTRWLADHAERHRILFAVHEGDVVNDNDEAQWRVASAALRELDGRVPYALALGNHDYGPRGCASDRSTRLHDYFAAEELEARPSFAGVFEAGRIDNSAHVFDTPGGPWLALALEFAPRDAVVEWADRVLSAHARVPALVVTHAYLYDDATRYDRRTRPDQSWSPYEYAVARAPGGANDGEELYRKLVRRRANVRFVFSGHVLGLGAALLTSPLDCGGVVHQMLANYQHRARGGDGYLRLVEVNERAGRARVRTYSPALGAYRTGPADRFDLPLAPRG